MATRLTQTHPGVTEWLDTATGEPPEPARAPEPAEPDPRKHAKSRAWGRAIAGIRPEPSVVSVDDLAAEYGMSADDLLAVPGMASLASTEGRRDFSGRLFLARADVAELVANPRSQDPWVATL